MASDAPYDLDPLEKNDRLSSLLVKLVLLMDVVLFSVEKAKQRALTEKRRRSNTKQLRHLHSDD